MLNSPSVDVIIPALFKVKNELKGVAKQADNPFFRSKYADLNSILEEVEPLLAKNGIILLQPITSKEGGDFVETLLLHESGQWISSSMSLVLNKSSMQDAGSAVSYARRYTLQALLSIKAEDDDGNAVSSKKETKSKPVQTASPEAKKVVEAPEFKKTFNGPKKAEETQQQNPVKGW